MTAVDPKYRCQRCHYEFIRTFKKGESAATPCLRCGHLYVDWLNWEEFRKSLGRYWEL